MVINIKKIIKPEDIQKCARLMADVDPWLKLGLGFNYCVKKLKGAEKEIYLALCGSDIAGFIVITMSSAFKGYVQTICVAEKYRSKGIGTQLLDFAEEKILKKTPNVFMCVSSFNKRAQKLYEKLGYEKVGELKDYVIKGHSEFILRKTTGPMIK